MTHQAQITNYVKTPQNQQSKASMDDLFAKRNKSDLGLLEKSPGFQPDYTAIRELWNIAYEKLREEDSALIKKYEAKLRGDVAAGHGLMLGPNASSRDRMQTILKHKMKEVNQNIWKLRFKSSEIEIRHLIQPVLNVVNFINGYITGAASANSYASIAWAGISLLIPFFMNPSPQNASLAKELAFISSLISHSQMREELYVRRYKSSITADYHSVQQSHHEYEIGLQRLYKQILKFQAITYCYCANNTASSLQLDIIKSDDWDELISDIRQQETAFADLSTVWRDIQYHEECSAAESRHKETVNVWHTVEKDISGLREAVEEAQRERSCRKLLQSLCYVDHTVIYNGARDRHEAGTGEWLVKNSKQFETWEKGSKSLLWLHGKAGSGKSILSSSVIKHLDDRYNGDASTALAYFYFSFSNYEKQNIDVMLASLVKQISARRPYIPQIVRRLGEHENQGGRPDTKTLEEALITSLHGFSAVYIIIDGLDECPERNERKKLLKSLQHIFTKAPDSLHILYTSRKELDIDTVLRPLLFSQSTTECDLSIQRHALDNDIGRYIDSTLRTAKYDSWSESNKEKAKRTLIEKAEGMFQYVHCQFESLQNLSSADALDEALQSLPSGLDAAYDRMLQRLGSEFQPEILKCLKWLAFSIIPLRVDELAEIFVFNPNADDALNEMEQRLPLKDVLKYFTGLVDTYAIHDTIHSHVRLAHLSIKEYLTSDRISQSPASTFSFTEIDAHMCIVLFCQRYHLLRSAISRQEGIVEYKLKYYASDYWAEHLEMIPRGSWPSEVMQDAALALATRSQSLFNMVQHARQLSGKLEMQEASNVIERLLLQPHLYTARRGYYQLTKMLISPGIHANKYLTHEDLDMGLRDAVFAGRMNIVELFLDMGADLNAGSKERALHIAASQGHVAIMEFLLDQGADINAQSDAWGSALEATLHCKQLDALKILVNRGANVNNSSKGRSVLMTAVIYSYALSLDYIQVLLDHGADISRQVFELAASCGDDRVFNLLLERGADVNALCRHHVSPAVRLGRIERLLDLGVDLKFLSGSLQALCKPGWIDRVPNEEVIQTIKLLIDKGVNVNGEDGRGLIALHIACATVSSTTILVELLLENGADVNIGGRSWGSALQAACQSGVRYRYYLDYYPGAEPRTCALNTVQLLLDRGANIHTQGGRYGTALQAACFGGTEDIVRLLIDLGADVNTQGGRYGTSLQAAAIGSSQSTAGRIGIAKLLIDNGANVNAQAGKYGTALQAACASGFRRMEMVCLLLENGADVNAEGGEHRTALQAACRGKIGDVKVVRLLLDHGANIHLHQSGTWHEAVSSNNDNALLELLLDHGADVNDAGGLHGTALNATLLRVQERGRDELEPSEKSFEYPEGRTEKFVAWRDAGLFNWTERVRFLLQHGADVNLVAGEYGTALQTACAVQYLDVDYGDFIDYRDITNVGHDRVKHILTNCRDININAHGGLFGSALQAAAYSGQTKSIKSLLNRGAQVNARGGKYGSALNAAIIRGFWDIVQILLDAGATPDCHTLLELDKKWLQLVCEEHGQGAVERYRKFWEVEKVNSKERDTVINRVL